MSTSIFKVLALALLMTVGCSQEEKGGNDLAPLPLESLPLPSLDDDAGLYPSKAVLSDPNNPFATIGVNPARRWEITGWALAPGVPVSRLSALFYVWATELARSESGESQFQVAGALRALATSEALTETQRTAYRLAAIRAYQSMLDNFKDSLGYTAEGYSYRLVPLAFYAIRDLGGTPQGRWIETVDPYDNKIVVEY